MTTYDTPLFRATDPETSRDAVPSESTQATNCQRCLDALAWLGGSGTRSEIANRAGLPDTGDTGSRLSQLKRRLLIFDTHTTRVGDNGKSQTVWRLTEAGWKEAEK
jgi:hypothetical protein